VVGADGGSAPQRVQADDAGLWHRPNDAKLRGHSAEADVRTLGLIGGLSWESTQIYYRVINEGVRARLGGLHSAQLLLWSFDFAEIEARQAAGDWAGATTAMADAARRLARAGAEGLLVCSNTMHRMADEVEAAAGLPLLHIADATAARLRASGAQRPGLLATRYTMEQAFYRGRLQERHGLDVLVPDEPGRTLVHDVIYDELCQGIVRAESKAAYRRIVADLRAQGADSLILGCTEVGMLIAQADVDLPVFDTTLIHGEEAVRFLIGA
jgi:aspartate racemase